MDLKLKQDLEHYFDVFRNNTKYDMATILPPVPVVKKYQKELEAELEALHTAVMNRIEEELRY